MNNNPMDKDYASGKGKRDSVSECQKLCQCRKGCLFFTYHSSSKSCFLKAGRIIKASFVGWVSGRKYCQGKFPTENVPLRNSNGFKNLIF